MEISIRKATKADIPEIYNLVVELAIYEKEPNAVSATLADYLSDFESQAFDCHVASVENSIIGIAIHFPYYSTWKGKIRQLEDLVVTADHRRSGVGQLLFDAVLAYTKSKNERMLRWQVLDWNEPAIAFYAKNNSTIEKNWWNVKINLA